MKSLRAEIWDEEDVMGAVITDKFGIIPFFPNDVIARQLEEIL